MRLSRKIYEAISVTLDLSLGKNPNLDGRSSDELLLLLPDAVADNHYYQASWVNRYLNKVFSIQAPIDKLLHLGFSRRVGLLAARILEAEGKDLYYWLKERPDMATSAGWVFEGRTHSTFMKGRKLRCKRLTPPGELRTMYKEFLSGKKCSQPVRKSREDSLRNSLNASLEIDMKKSEASVSAFASVKDLSAKLRSRPGSQSFDRTLDGIYLHPAYPNLGAIDSLTVTVDAHKQPRAFFFQMTIAL